MRESGWNLRDHIPLDEVIVQSHRGAGHLMPENSVQAFELAWSLGTIPEADLRTTKDGVIVAFHDPNFSRILPNATAEEKARGMGDLTWEEVSQLDIGAWKGQAFEGQRAPSLADVFRLLKDSPERRIYVDIKETRLDQLAREAGAAGVTRQLILAGTLYDLLRKWKSLAPESETLHWMGGTQAQLAGRLDALRQTGFAAIDQLQIHVRRAEGGFVPSPRFLAQTGAELRSRGILFQVLPWEMDEPQAFIQLMELGAASFATDYPDIAMRTIRDYYAAST